MGCGASTPKAVMKPQDEQAASVTLLQEPPSEVKVAEPEEPKVPQAAIQTSESLRANVGEEAQASAQASAYVGEDASKQTLAAEVISIEKEAPQVIAPETSESQQGAEESPCLGQDDTQQTPLAEFVAAAEQVPEAIAVQTSESQQEAEASACVGEESCKQTPADEVVSIALEPQQVNRQDLQLKSFQSQHQAEASAWQVQGVSEQTLPSIEKEVPQVIAPETSESQQEAEETPCLGQDNTEQIPVAAVTATADLVGGPAPEEAGVTEASVEAVVPAELANADASLNHCVVEEA